MSAHLSSTCSLQFEIVTLPINKDFNAPIVTITGTIVTI